MSVKNPDLYTLQQAFQDAILHLQQEAPSFIAGGEQTNTTERYRVYTEAYRLRLIEALSADYPALQTFLSEVGFAQMGRAYIDVMPSHQFSIRWFGQHLPGFLAKTLPYAEQIGLCELALFEWSLSLAFDASESAMLARADLEAIAPEQWPQLKLNFQPPLQRIDLRSNAPQVWQAVNLKQSLPAFLVAAESTAWVIWRQELKLMYRPLTQTETYALDGFLAGLNFAEVCAGLLDFLPEEQVLSSVVGFLQTWLSEAWLLKVALPN